MPVHGKHHPEPPERRTHAKEKAKTQPGRKPRSPVDPAGTVVSKGSSETPDILKDTGFEEEEPEEQEERNPQAPPDAPQHTAIPGRRYQIGGREIFAKQDGWYYKDTGEPVQKSHEVQ